MKKLYLILILLVLVTIFSFFMINRQNVQKKLTEVKISWPKPTLKKVPPKFKSSLNSLFVAEVKNIDYLAKTSDLIVIGQVKKISDLKASMTTDTSPTAYPMIYQDAAIVIEQIIKGNFRQPFVTVRKYGGKISENQQVWVEDNDMGEFKLNERVLIFLWKPKIPMVDDGIEHYEATPLSYTKFAIIGNEAVRGPYELPLPDINQQREDERDRPLSNPAPMGLSVDERRFPLDKLISEIKENL